jgi:hypothetical protein
MGRRQTRSTEGELENDGQSRESSSEDLAPRTCIYTR